MKDPVEIFHEKTKGTAIVGRQAYELVWKDKGWRLKNPSSPSPTSQAATETTTTTSTQKEK